MKIDDIFKRVKVNRLLWIILGALLVIILFTSLNRFFDHDEFEAVHTSWKMLQGEIIYVDFFQHHHPFLYYMLIPIISILGENIHTIIAIRLMIFLMFLLILFIIYLITRDNFDKEIVATGLLLLSSTYIFVIKVIEIRPNIPETLFALVSIFFFLKYIKKRNLLYLVLSAFSLGIAFLFFQLALFLVLFIGCLLLFDVYKKNTSFLDVLAYFVVFLLTLAPYGTYLVLTDSFYSYFQFNWILNMKVLNRFLPFNGLFNIYSVNTILCIFYVIGILFYLKTSNQKRIGVLSLVLLLSVFLVRTPWPQYFMLAIPLMAIISAHAIYSIFKNNKAILFVMLVLSTGPQINWLAQGAQNTNEGQLKKIAYVMSITNKDDLVYDGHILFNVFRKDIDFFWYSIDPHLGTLETFQTMTDYHYNVYEIIDRVKPKVISNYNIDNMEDYRIKNHYVQSEHYQPRRHAAPAPR